MRALVATNDQAISIDLAEAYSQRGYETVLGLSELFSPSTSFDLVHLHWPEELVGWKTPRPDDIKRLNAALKSWHQTSCVVATIHNLFPHSPKKKETDRQLYLETYSNCSLIGHFSNYSKKEFSKYYPEITTAHVVHKPFLYERFRPAIVKPDVARRHFPLSDDQPVALLFGALRSKTEAEFVLNALRLAPGSLQTLFAARLGLESRVQRGLGELQLALLSLRMRIERTRALVPDESLPLWFGAADAVIVPRMPPHLNSGVFMMARTLGRPVIAPAYGPFLEYCIEGWDQLYEPGDSKSLASALGKLQSSRHSNAPHSLEAATSGWGWGAIVDALLAELHGCSRA